MVGIISVINKLKKKKKEEGRGGSSDWCGVHAEPLENVCRSLLVDLLSLESLFFPVSSVVMYGCMFHLNTEATNHREEAKEVEAFK